MATRTIGFMAVLPVVFALLAVAWVPPSLAQERDRWGGFTVLEITNDAIHEAVGINHGFRDGKATLLLTLIAGDRSYASITKGYHAFYPDCVTWIGPEEGPSDQVVLGDGDSWLFHAPREVWSQSGLPTICAEFRLEKLGPKQALFIQGDLRVVLPIVANYPILAVDWADPSVSRFRNNGYGLGPVTENDIPRMYSRPEGVARTQPELGSLKRLYFRSQADSGQVNVRALADIDRLMSEGQAEIVWLDYDRSRAPTLGLTESFYQAMRGRYGPPSAVIAPSSRAPIWIWAHDLHGRFLSDGGDIDDDCLTHVKDNVRFTPYPPAEVSTWNCGLVMILRNVSLKWDAGGDPATARVVGYKIQWFHGHAMAHHVFSDRLALVDAARENVPERAAPSLVVDSLPGPEENAMPGRRAIRRAPPPR